MGRGHAERQQLKVQWAATRGALPAEERDSQATIQDIRAWHEWQEVHAQLIKESLSRFVMGFVTADGRPIILNEQEIFSVLDSVGYTSAPSLCGRSQMAQAVTLVAASLWVGGQSAGKTSRGGARGMVMGASIKGKVITYGQVGHRGKRAE